VCFNDSSLPLKVKVDNPMTIVDVVKALGPIDAKSVRRDPLLRWLVFYPLLMAAILRWGVPLLRNHLMIRYQFDLEPYYSLLMSVVLLMTPMLAGTVVGFLLLDQRDDQTLIALQVTSLTLGGYFVYRVAVPTLLSFVVTVLVLPVTGLLRLGPFVLMVTALSACLLAPLYALFLGAFAANKVQGFALAKAAGVLFVPLLVAYFVEPPLQLLFGIDPLYWPAKFLWAINSRDGAGWIYLLVGVLFQWTLLRFLMRRLNRAE
jgi:fluoroquinolone transport system permease protein